MTDITFTPESSTAKHTEGESTPYTIKSTPYTIKEQNILTYTFCSTVSDLRPLDD
jgi:hypothetical protein